MPKLADISGETFINEADIRNIYSLIPIPPIEKTERIEEQIKTTIISMKLSSMPSDRTIHRIARNCKN